MKVSQNTLNTVHEGNIIERHTGGLEREKKEREYINFLGKRILNGNDIYRELREGGRYIQRVGRKPLYSFQLKHYLVFPKQEIFALLFHFSSPSISFSVYFSFSSLSPFCFIFFIFTSLCSAFSRTLRYVGVHSCDSTLFSSASERCVRAWLDFSQDLMRHSDGFHLCSLIFLFDQKLGFKLNESYWHHSRSQKNLIGNENYNFIHNHTSSILMDGSMEDSILVIVKTFMKYSYLLFFITISCLSYIRMESSVSFGNILI